MTYYKISYDQCTICDIKKKKIDRNHVQQIELHCRTKWSHMITNNLLENIPAKAKNRRLFEDTKMRRIMLILTNNYFEDDHGNAKTVNTCVLDFALYL